MTFKEFFIDLWLSMRYGRWYVEREPAFRGGDRRGWKYFVKHSRTNERIDCYSKQIAEGAAACNNDLRGHECWRGL